jgi:hypothetical protein
MLCYCLHASIPKALRVCKESRHEALKRYQPAFFPGLYVDFQTDIFFDTSATVYKHLVNLYKTWSGEFKKMQYLAAHWVDCEDLLPLLEPGCLPSAKKVIMVENGKEVDAVQEPVIRLREKKDEQEFMAVILRVISCKMKRKGYEVRLGVVGERGLRLGNYELDF